MATPPDRPHQMLESDSPAARAEALSIERTVLRGTPPVDPKALVVDPRRLIKVFVSYAHEDAGLKEELLRRLGLRLSKSTHYRFELWDDREIEPGKLWHEGIQKAIAECDYGLLLVSWDFLNRDYILSDELPHFVSVDPKIEPEKRAIPVGIKKILFGPHLNLHGLDRAQIFLLEQTGAKRYFANGKTKDDFADTLFERLIAIVGKDFPVDEGREPEPPRYKAVVEIQEERRSIEEMDRGKLFEWFSRPPRPVVPIDPDRVLEGKALETSMRQGYGEGPSTFGRPVEVLTFLRDWVTDPRQPPFCALLGEYGMGKTTACEMFARRLIEDRKADPGLPVPILLDLRNLGDDARNNPLLEEVLRIVATRTYGEEAPPAKEIMDLVRSGYAVAIFDGLDEVLVHLTESKGQRFTRELWRILPPRRLPAPGKMLGKYEPRGKLLISCRTHYFRTLRDERSHFLGEDREAIRAADYRALVLLPFTAEQILEYLRRTFPDQDAGKLLDMIRSIHNLEELAERPYTLNLITEHIPNLERWKLDGLKVTGVTLYREMVTSWLDRDTGKHTLTKEHKQLLMETFAAEMWKSVNHPWPAGKVEQWLLDFLAANPRIRLHYEGKERELLKEDLRTATFLVRDWGDGFRFAHTSLQEFFLSAYLHRALLERRFEEWQIPIPSQETLDFLGQLLAEKDAEDTRDAFREFRCAYRQQASELLLTYAFRAHEKGLPAPALTGIRLDGANLQGWTIAAPVGSSLLDLQGASFRSANLQGAKLHRIDASEADFRGADLSCAELMDGKGALARFEESVLVGTMFRDLGMSGSSFVGARLHRTQWVRCRLAGVSGLEDVKGGLFADCVPNNRNPHLDHVKARFSVLRGHQGTVNSCVFSTDGARLASAGNDGSVRLWDTATGEVYQVLEGHWGPVSSCAYSPDGSRIASVGNDGSVRLWNAASGEALHVLKGHRGSVLSCTFSPDGLCLASSGVDGTVRLWNVYNGKVIRVLRRHRSRVKSCAFSPDGSLLASAGDDCCVRVWNVANGKARRIFKHLDWVNSCVFSPDGSRLASAGDDCAVRLWNAASGEELLVFQERTYVRSCAFSIDGSRLGFAGRDFVKFQEIGIGEPSRFFQNDKTSCCTFSPDGSLFASTKEDAVKLWGATDGKPYRTLEGHRCRVNSCAFSPDGSRLASAVQDGSTRIWGTDTGKAIRTLERPRNEAGSCAFSPDGRRIATAGDEGVRVWDTVSGEVLAFREYWGPAWSCAFSPDGSLIASTGGAGFVRLLDVVSGKILQVLGGGQDRAFAFSPGGFQLASVGADDSVRLWDANSGQVLQVLQGHRGMVLSCAFSPDGFWLASAGTDGSVRLWDALSGKPLRKLQGHRVGVTSCVFSPDGFQLASTGTDGSLRLWDVVSGKALWRLQGQRAEAKSCAFSPNGSRLASAGGDGTVRMWDAESGREVGRIEVLPDGETASFFGPDLALSYASPGAWRWLGWLASDPATGEITRYSAEVFGPLPGESGMAKQESGIAAVQSS